MSPSGNEPPASILTSSPGVRCDFRATVPGVFRLAANGGDLPLQRQAVAADAMAMWVSKKGCRYTCSERCPGKLKAAQVLVLLRCFIAVHLRLGLQ